MIHHFKKKYPAYYFIFLLLLTTLVFFYFLNRKEKYVKEKLLSESNKTDHQGSNQTSTNYSGAGGSESYEKEVNPQNNGKTQNSGGKASARKEKQIIKTSTGGLTRPILMVETPSPSEEMAELDISLNRMVVESKHNGKIKSASIYVMDMDNDNWIEVNDTEGYYPGSLMKLAVLICYLKKSEENPEILSKTLTLEKNAIAPGQSYKDEVIKPGIPYKISDLLDQMIVRSDNFATLLLNRELDINELNKLFHVLGLPKMDMHNIHYTITAKDYSKFMRVLYTATYLNVNNSQYALSMMSHSAFNKGLTRYLPQNVIVAHKFGENVSGNIRELHESGIVYTGSHTYLITVMTKGERVNDLADEISEISKQVYAYFMP